MERNYSEIKRKSGIAYGAVCAGPQIVPWHTNSSQ